MFMLLTISKMKLFMRLEYIGTAAESFVKY